MTSSASPRSRSLASAVVALSMLVLLGACGDPVVGGSGRLIAGSDGAPDVLLLEGSPYEMGWWHGRLLKDRIGALHERWQGLAIRSQVGLAHDLERGAAADLTDTIDLFVDQTLERLPERMRQELTGLSEGSGVPIETLLFTEVMRDGLRIWLGKMEPRLPGALAAVDSGPEVRAWWTGADTDVLDGAWLVVQRSPDRGVGTVLLSWPGSVGGIAGMATNGLGYVFCEADVDAEMRGFGGGVPYPLGTRLAIESTDDLDRMRAEISGTAGHSVITLARDPSRVIGSVEVYRGVQDELFLGRSPFILIGPWQDVRAGRRRAKLPRDAAPKAVFEAARALVETQASRGPRCVIRGDGEGDLVFHVSGRPGGQACAFRLADGAIVRQ